jgi:hypothetical protein
MRLTAVAKIGLGTSAALVALTVAEPAVAWAGGSHGGGAVPCAGQPALVAAINAANSAGGGTINLTPRCHYDLTTPDNGENGLPVISSTIRVNGWDATIDGTTTVRVFEVDGPGGNLTLNDLTITGGSAADFGGGIANIGGTVTLNHTQVTDNQAVLAGGGIASATFDPSSVARLTLNNSAVTDNTQTLPGNPESGSGGLGGGGIINLLGSATLNSSRVNGNTAQGLVGGGIASGDYMNFTGTTSVLTVNDSQVNDNTAPIAGGGGIQNLLGTTTVNRSQVNNNTSLNGGGISSGNGNGGMAPCNGTVTINWSQVDGNTATAPVPSGPGAGPPIAAGGIANGCTTVINNSRIGKNVAAHTSGAGIVNHGTMTLNRSVVFNNTAEGQGPLASGGGIINAVAPGGANSGILTLNASVVVANSAGGNGGGISNGLALGQMTLPGGPVTLNHSLVIANTASAGGGIFNTGGTVTLSASLVIGNHPDNCEPLGTVTGCLN